MEGASGGGNLFSSRLFRNMTLFQTYANFYLKDALAERYAGLDSSKLIFVPQYATDDNGKIIAIAYILLQRIK